MEWLVILPAIGMGTVLGAAITQIVTWVREAHGETKRQAREAVYTAMRTAVALETFAWACDEHVKDRSVTHSMGMIDAPGKLPRLMEFPASVDWRFFDTRLASEVLGFPARVEAAQNEANRLSWEINDHWESEPAAITLGDAAVELATRIRARYALDECAVPIDVAARLRKRKMELDRRRDEWRERMAAERQDQERPPPIGPV